MKKVTVVGLGYVGLPLALVIDEAGYETTGVDLDEKKVKAVNDRHDPLGDDFVKKYIKDTKLTAATNMESIVGSDVVVVCVPTPVNSDYSPNLSPLKGAVSSIAEHLTKDTLIIIESTINPGVSDEVLLPLLERETNLVVNKDFWLSHCPERINPGDEKWNVKNIARVAGSSNDVGLEKTISFYESFVDADTHPMNSLKEAEAVKVVENSFRDINIAFVNELAKSFTKLGIDVKNVIDGASTKPFAFMPHYPSVGVGGHCIPVDPYYLIEYARGYGFEHEFLSLARSINNSMPEFTVDQLISGLNELGLSLKGTTVAVLGLSYKANVADDRESPSYDVIEILNDKGADVTTYDPYLPQKSSAKNLEQALDGVDAAVLATNHREFLDFDYTSSSLKVIVDGKNALGGGLTSDIFVKGIGR